MTDKLSKALRLIDLFADLPAPFAVQLAQFSLLRQIRSGETIFCQGEPSPYCFGIISGQVTIQRVPHEKGFPPKILSVLGPGSLFGEQALFKESPRTAMAVASQDGELIAIQGKPFRDWLEKDKTVGLPLIMGVLQNTLSRLRQTSHELSLVYGVGRSLAANKPIKERICDTANFLRASLEGVDEIIVYQLNPYWEEFEPLVIAPQAGDPPVLPLQHPLVEKVLHTSIPIVSQEAREIQGNAAVALVPFLDIEDSQHPLQGFLWAANKKNPGAFSPSILLLLSAVSAQFTEAILRQHRQEDQDAQARLRQSRQSFRI